MACGCSGPRVDRGSDFDDSTFFAVSFAERISFVRKKSKARGSCKREVLISAMIRCKTQGKEIVVKIVRRKSGSSPIVTFWARVISFLGGIVAKRMLGL